MPRILAETLHSPAELARATQIPFEPIIPIGKPEGLGRMMPGLSVIPKDVRGLYTIWASCRGAKPVLLYGGKCVADSGIRHRILTHFLRSQNEGKAGRLHLNGGSYLQLLFEHMGLSAEYFISIVPIEDAPTIHAKEKALLFQIDFIANGAENSKRRGEDLKALFVPSPALAVSAEPIVVEAPLEVVPPSANEEVPVVEENPKKVKKVKRASDEKVARLISDLTEARAHIAELETRVKALETEKMARKTLCANLRMYTDAVAKLAPIYMGNAFLETTYASAVEQRDTVCAQLMAMDV